MKRSVLMAFSSLMLCSLLLLITVGTIKAGNPDYWLIEYACVAPAVIDGEWTSDDEWTDGPLMTISDSASFTYNIDFGDYVTLTVQWVIEIFDDNTNDAEDYWQICLDSDNSGGTAPQNGDFRMDIVGHTDLVCYAGTGQGWTEITPQAGEIDWADSISASPWNSTPHWILEFSLIKTSGAITTGQPPNGMRVAVYDASNSQAGVQAWAPGSDPDVPDEWGVIAGYSETPIPEVLTFGVIVLLLSISVIIVPHFYRKWSRT